MRYGGNFRGLKVKVAQDAGAAGILIFSDPSEDGECKRVIPNTRCLAEALESSHI